MSQAERRSAWQFQWHWILYLLVVLAIGFNLVQWIRQKRATPGTPTGKVLAELDSVDRIQLPPGAAAGCNVLVITMDTTRADHLGCYGNKGVATPVIDDLARRGVLFARAYTPSPSTLPGHSSIFTGLNPYRHGARANGTYRLGPENVTLAEILRDNGYATGGVIAAYVLDSRFGLGQGFDMFGDDLTNGVKYSDHSFRERPAELVNEVAVEWLDTVGDQPFFLWVHYFDPHAPCYAPEPFRSQYASNPYNGEIAYVDDQIGKLLTHLTEVGRLDDTLVVLAADHGEGLGEHGEQTHSLLVYDSTLHTPLIVCPPASKSAAMGHVVQRPVGNVDIMPTVLDLLAIETEADLDGVSLLDGTGNDRSLYAETISTLVLHGWSPLFSARKDGLKYIHAPRPELYDLENDPKELDNLFDSRPDAAAAMSQALAMHIGEDLFGSEALAQAVEMDPETARALDALGYVGSVADLGDEGDQVRLDPKDMVPHWDRVQAAGHALDLGHFNEGVAELEACLEIVPNDIWALRELAQAYLARNDLEKARTMTDRVLALDENDSGSYLMLGQLQKVAGRPAKAEEAIRKAIELDPHNAFAYVVLGSLYADLLNPEQATEAFETAIEMDPGTAGPQAYNAMGRMRIGRLELDLAREAFTAALAINELYGPGHRGMAMVLIEEGDLAAAQDAMDQAVRFLPNDTLVWSTLAALSVRRGEFDEGIGLAQRALDINPRFPQALDAMGCARAGSGDLAGARVAFETLLEHAPNDVPTIVHLARLEETEGRPDEAAVLYQRALDMNPYQPTALINLATYKVGQGEHDEAIELYGRAVALQPDNALAHHHLGMVLLARERPGEALPHLEESLRLDPDQPDHERLTQVVNYLRSAQGAESGSDSPSSP